jgi:uncharacterized protein (TIGR02266 family)
MNQLAKPPSSTSSPSKSARPEQRASQRTRVETSVDLHTETNFFAGLSEDLSDGGLFIATYELLPVGTAITISFTLPNERRVNASARVVWLREPRDGGVSPGMGVRFDSLSEADMQAIRAFLQERAPFFYDM